MGGVSHYLLSDSKVITHVFAGRVTFQECIGAVGARGGGNARLVLWDFTGTTEFELDPGQLREVVREIATLNRPADARTAIAAASDLIFGMARMVESYAELERVKHPVRTFREKRAAVEWLLHGESDRRN